MANSKIEWTQKVWNPVTGCTKVSPGCVNCYVNREWPRLAGNVRSVYHGRKFTDVQCHPERLGQPFRWTKPKMIFVNSMSDLFHPDVPFGFVDHIINASYRAPQHTYLILTKRPERMQLYFESCAERGIPAALWMRHGLRLWLGVTAENQEQAEKRIPTLLQVPAALRFVSVEPMLSAVDLTSITIRQRINWVICGGESGPGARPMHPDWVRSLRDQCQDAGVPFFLKSWGEWEPSETVPWKDTAYHRVSDGSIASYLLGVKKHWWGGNDGDGKPLSVRVGKKAAGHLLDGLEWREMPHQM